MDERITILLIEFLRNKCIMNKARSQYVNTLLLRNTNKNYQIVLDYLHQSASIYTIVHLPNAKEVWMKPRSNEPWAIIWDQYDHNDWIENFRMTKDSFQILCSMLRSSLEPKTQTLKPREPVSVEKQVAVCVFKFCSCAEYRVVGSIFGIHKSTVKKCVYNVTEAIINHMLEGYIYMPNSVEAEEISGHFEKITKLPMLIGAIDGTHIPIKPPRDGYRDFVNRKGWPSYNMQAVVDNNCRFRNVFVQYPGSAHDASVLKGSNLYKHHNKVLPQERKIFNGVHIKYMIIGDPAYPLLDWIIKGYSGTCTPEEESFNAYLNAGRVVVEWAFGRLKARFRILQKRIDVNYQFVPKVVIACCILHNFIEDRKESFVQQWVEAVQAAELILPQPKSSIQTFSDTQGTVVRTKYCQYLAANFELKRSSLR